MVRKLDEGKVKELLEMGYSYGQIARMLGVTKGAVRQFCVRRGWYSQYSNPYNRRYNSLWEKWFDLWLP